MTTKTKTDLFDAIMTAFDKAGITAQGERVPGRPPEGNIHVSRVGDVRIFSERLFDLDIRNRAPTYRKGVASIPSLVRRVKAELLWIRAYAIRAAEHRAQAAEAQAGVLRTLGMGKTAPGGAVMVGNVSFEREALIIDDEGTMSIQGVVTDEQAAAIAKILNG
jgi:hypothetical protein